MLKIKYYVVSYLQYEYQFELYGLANRQIYIFFAKTILRFISL